MQRAAIHQAAHGNVGAAVVLSGAARKQHAVGNAKQAARHAPPPTVVVVGGAGHSGVYVVRPKHVVFALDCSGSMAGAPMDSASESMLKIFQNRLAPNDKVSFIRFNDSARTVLKSKTKAQHSHDIVKAFSDRSAGGRTAFWDAMVSGLELLDKTDKGEDQWIIALTDGDDNASKKDFNVVINLLKYSTSQNVRVVVIALGNLQEEYKMRELCQASKHGLYIQAAANSKAISDAFVTVDNMMSGPSPSDASPSAPTAPSSAPAAAPAFCTACGASVAGAKFCPGCGAAVPASAPTTSPPAPYPTTVPPHTTGPPPQYQQPLPQQYYQPPPQQQPAPYPTSNSETTPLVSKEEKSSSGGCCTIL